MGGHTISVCNQPPRPTQPPTICGTGNEYRLKCGDALWLGEKAGWLIPFVNPSSTRAILGALETSFVIKRYTNLRLSHDRAALTTALLQPTDGAAAVLIKEYNTLE